MARQPWILWLDADEVFPKETLDALEKSGLPADVGGYRICRRVIFEGRTICHGDWGNDWVLRVFPRDNYTMADRIVHESVEVSGRVVDLPGVVEHHSFRNWKDLEARSIKYAELWATQAVLDKKKPRSPALRAAWKFFRGYVIKSGWLDGKLGFQIARHNAREVRHKYQRLRELSVGQS